MRRATKGRIGYAAAAFLTIGLGIAWRSRPFASVLPEILRKYGGDALWAVMVYWCLRAVAPELRLWKSAAVAAVISAAVEFSQLYHAPWIDAVRAYRLGMMVLGSTFNLPDLGAYAVGIGLAVVMDAVWTRH